MLLHVLMFWGLLARPVGRSDWPAENYPVRTSRVMRKAGAARRRLAEKLPDVTCLCRYNCRAWKIHLHSQENFGVAAVTVGAPDPSLSETWDAPFAGKTRGLNI